MCILKGMGTQPVKAVNLTQVAETSRKLILVSSVVLGFLVVGRFFLNSFTIYWTRTHPKPPPPPTRGFGILPEIVFPKSVGTPVAYRLETAPRTLQPPSDRAPVFFMPAQRASLLSLDRAKKQANNLGYILEPEQITSSLYRWKRNQPLQSILDYNINNGTFTSKLDWQSDPNFLQQKKLPTEDDAINLTRSLLSSTGLMQGDIATGSARITYLKSSVNGYTPTVSLSESDFLQVDIFRTPIGSRYDVIMDEPDHGAVRTIISGNAEQSSRFALIEYKVLPVDYVNFETYPIISPGEAFALLKAGKGYVAAMTPDQSEVIIRGIRLGYYDSYTQQQYLQPIYILEGDGGFVAYVPAIQAIWTQQ